MSSSYAMVAEYIPSKFRAKMIVCGEVGVSNRARARVCVFVCVDVFVFCACVCISVCLFVTCMCVRERVCMSARA